MNWVRAIVGVLVLWSGTAWGATLTWTANSEPDLAGYRVYQCVASRHTGNGDKFQYRDSGSDSVLLYYSL